MEEDIKSNGKRLPENMITEEYGWNEWVKIRQFKYEQLFMGQITMEEYIHFIEDFYKKQTDKI